MRHSFAIIVSILILMTGCTPATTISTPEIITVQYTAATIPWLAGVTNCAGGNIVSSEQRAADLQDTQSFDLTLRIGEPTNLTSPAYQIGKEDIQVIVNPKNPVKSLTGEQVRGIFSGQMGNWQGVGGSDANIQVWVFSSGEDVQQVFETAAMNGSSITSNAHLATSPDEMAKAIASDENAVGILTQKWIGGNDRAVFSAASAPVLALTMTAPQSAITNLIACLQNPSP